MESEEIIDKGIEGENFVTKLAETSYLKYWCYPNPMDMTGDKKEICDLLILFFDTAIIISVKNYNVNGNYERFLKRVVEKSSKQLFGAQRKLFGSKEIVLQKIFCKVIENLNLMTIRIYSKSLLVLAKILKTMTLLTMIKSRVPLTYSIDKPLKLSFLNSIQSKI